MSEIEVPRRQTDGQEMSIAGQYLQQLIARFTETQAE
jgi:hypothetical protein